MVTKAGALLSVMGFSIFLMLLRPLSRKAAFAGAILGTFSIIASWFAIPGVCK
jgi:hypothetical protein